MYWKDLSQKMSITVSHDLTRIRRGSPASGDNRVVLPRGPAVRNHCLWWLRTAQQRLPAGPQRRPCPSSVAAVSVATPTAVSPDPNQGIQFDVGYTPSPVVQHETA